MSFRHFKRATPRSGEEGLVVSFSRRLPFTFQSLLRTLLHRPVPASVGGTSFRPKVLNVFISPPFYHPPMSVWALCFRWCGCSSGIGGSHHLYSSSFLLDPRLLSDLGFGVSARGSPALRPLPSPIWFSRVPVWGYIWIAPFSPGVFQTRRLSGSFPRHFSASVIFLSRG